MILLGVVIVFFPQVKGMDLAHLTREAAIQGTEVALGVWTQAMLKTLGTTCT